MARPKLQLALDFPQAFAALAASRPFVDIVEVGTPLLKRFGLAAIATARELAPDALVLADSKTVDGGAGESAMLFEAGADLITVLSSAPEATIDAVAAQASARGRSVVVDTVTERDPRDAALRDYPHGIDYVSLHTSTDSRLAGTAAPADTFALAREVAASRNLVLAGGIDAESIAEAVLIAPAVIVVGRSITLAGDPHAAAARIAQELA